MFCQCYMMKIVQIMPYAVLKFLVNRCVLLDCEPVTLNGHVNLLVLLVISVIVFKYQR